jgi:membrane-associated protease RseP (regulator of RpoE activity)
MNRVRVLVGVGLVLGMVLGASTRAVGQEPVADACPEGSRVEGDIGISGLECTQCSFSFLDDGTELWSFRAEPTIRSVRRGSPAYGALREGDVILAINGVLITTSEGGRRYANIKPADTVELTIRRGRETMMVGLIASARCSRIGIAPGVPVPPVPTVAVEVDVVPEVAAVPGVAVVPEVAAVPDIRLALRYSFPSGWFGFGINCRCDIHAGRDGNPPVWKFREVPEVYSVEEDSPAGKAGLRHGDLLIEIDGEDITSDEGGRRFGAIKAGDTVTFEYRRGGRTQEVTMTAQERPARDRREARDAQAESLLRELFERRTLLETENRRLLEEAIRSGNMESSETVQLRRQLEQQHAQEIQTKLQLEQLLRQQRELARTAEVDRSDQLRFAGTVGNVEVEVRGSRSVVATVVEEGKEIVIITRDARIVIRLPEQ